MSKTIKVQAGERTQHTPGPWKHYAGYVYREGGEGANICAISDPFADEHVGYTPLKTGGRNNAVAYANAALIVAAPELLAAAKKTLAFINDLSKSNPGFLSKLVLQDYAQWNEAMMELPAAINKAEGK